MKAIYLFAGWRVANLNFHFGAFVLNVIHIVQLKFVEENNTMGFVWSKMILNDTVHFIWTICDQSDEMYKF